MNLALLEQKNLTNVLRQVESRNFKNQKRRKPSAKKSNLGEKYINLKILKAITTGIAMTILIAACLFGAFSGYRFVTTSFHFDINKINWFGHQRLSEEDLGLLVGPIIGENIFKLDLSEISQKLAEHPWVQTASARRVFPQGLYIKINERIPFARVQLNQAFIIDNYGILLGPDEKQFQKLPLIIGISLNNPSLGDNVASEELIRGLKMMYNINLLPLFKKNQIDTARISNQSRITFVTHDGNLKVHMRLGMAEKSFKNLMLVLETIKEEITDLSYIDLSFKNKIVIKNHKKLKKA